jgi:hypothetical protein
MSHEEARFQARAAMSGVGLTTNTPEDIVGHPVRRRIVFGLMVVGSARRARHVPLHRLDPAPQRVLRARLRDGARPERHYAVAERQVPEDVRAAAEQQG